MSSTAREGSHAAAGGCSFKARAQHSQRLTISCVEGPHQQCLLAATATPAKPHLSLHSSKQPKAALLPASLLPLPSSPPLLPLPFSSLPLLLPLDASACRSSSFTRARYASAKRAAPAAASSGGSEGSASAVRRKLPSECLKISIQSSSAGKAGMPLQGMQVGIFDGCSAGGRKPHAAGGGRAAAAIHFPPALELGLGLECAKQAVGVVACHIQQLGQWHQHFRLGGRWGRCCRHGDKIGSESAMRCLEEGMLDSWAAHAKPALQWRKGAIKLSIDCQLQIRYPSQPSRPKFRHRRGSRPLRAVGACDQQQ